MNLLAEATDALGGAFLIVLVLLLIVAGSFLLIAMRFIRLWFQAFVTGTPISLFNII
nr:hypothetical protein [Chlamydiota bacterium]